MDLTQGRQWEAVTYFVTFSGCGHRASADLSGVRVLCFSSSTTTMLAYKVHLSLQSNFESDRASDSMVMIPTVSLFSDKLPNASSQQWRRRCTS
ncbi:hypothetical protein OG21DRAFT_1537450, partial [Imleria badia]